MTSSSQTTMITASPVIIQRGLIFDCDGVLVDSEPISCRSLNVLFEENFKPSVDIGTNYDYALGKSTVDVLRYYHEKHSLGSPTLDELLHLSNVKEDIYYRLAGGVLRTFPGIRDVLKQARELSWPIGVGSSGQKKKIMFSLTEVGLQESFDHLVSAEEVKRGKPAPDLFLEVARRLGISPEHCVVVEDSITGIKAAKAAGALAVGITTSFRKEQLLEVGADLIIKDFTELDLTTLPFPSSTASLRK